MVRQEARILGLAAVLALIPACAGDSDHGTPFVPDAAPVQGVQGDGTTIGSGQPPFIRIVSPGPNTKAPEGATINVQAVAIDPDTNIVRVDYFDGHIPIGTRTSAPYIIAWGGLTAGTHILTATALNVQGLTAVSAPVTVIVMQRRGDDDDDDDDDRHGRHHHGHGRGHHPR